MSDVSFTVDPDGLDELRGELAVIESGMRGIGVTTAFCDPLDLGPDGDLWRALWDFSDGWSNGLSMICRNIDHLVGLLGRAAGDYRGTDDQVASQADLRPGAP